MRAQTLVTLSFLLAACATAPVRPGARPEVLQFDPVVVTPGSREELDLASFNDEELFALGTSAYAAGDFEKAARCFGRLADIYLDSSRRRDALYNAGLALERLNRFADALERFESLMDPAKGTGDALDAAFRVAECLYHLDSYAKAIAVLTVVADRDDIPFQAKLQAKVQRGICLIEASELETAERELRAALRWFEERKEQERLDEYFPSQAQFFLGEVYRLYFEQVELDPDKGTEKLAKDLEYKCELLLSAQGHYLRAIRIGDSQWVTAAGFRVGTLYENLYDAMLFAKAPKELDAEQAEVYRAELRKRVRVLVSKAMGIYERTLAAAERIGVDSPFVQQTKQSLDRMKQILVDEREREAAEAPAAEDPVPAEEGTERILRPPSSSSLGLPSDSPRGA